MEKQAKNIQLIISTVDRLRQLRHIKGETQEQVEDSTSVQVSKIEMGNTSPSLTTLAILCSYYGVTLSEFFEGVDIPKDILTGRSRSERNK